MNLHKYVFILAVSLIAAPAHAAKKKEEVVEMTGISIIGNRELPKTLFIVPWKNSEVGVETELTNTLNEGMQPLDREVFERELDYYEFSRPQ
jgi:hypothetical protein